MNNKLIRVSVIGLTSAAVINMSALSVSASTVANDVSIPGVTSVLKTATEAKSDADSVVRAGGLTTLAAVAEVSEEVKNEKKVSLISNLNYDRLGIAKVDNYLNIRKKPNESAKIVGKLTRNAGCDVMNTNKNGWAKIKSGDVTGYVMAKYLVKDEEAEEYAVEVGTKLASVETSTLNVRFVPSTDSSIYTLVPIEEELEVLKENLTKRYVQDFIKKNFKGQDKKYIKEVKQKEMLENLEDWMLVRIDNEKVFIAKEFVRVSYKLDKAVSIEEEQKAIEEAQGAISSNTTSTGTVSNKSTSSTVGKSPSNNVSSPASSYSGTSSKRSNMVAFAKQYLGGRYVFGGTSLSSGVDCSGFMMRVYQNAGYSIPRDSRSQAAAATTISSSNAKPGDLFFYGNGSRINHVAMYIGNGQVIHASNERYGIRISNAYYRTPMKVGRIIND